MEHTYFSNFFSEILDTARMIFTFCRHKTYVEKYLFNTPYRVKNYASFRFVFYRMNKCFKSQLQSVRTDACYTRILAYFWVHKALLRSTNQLKSIRVKQGQSVYRPPLCRKLQDNADPDLPFSEFISLLYRHFVGPLG